MPQQEVSSKYSQEPGRRVAPEYIVLDWLAGKLANKINPDVITVSGAVAGVIGSWLLGFPDHAIRTIEQSSNGHLRPPRGKLRITGAVSLAFAYFCDVLDGAVARKSTKGESKHGIVLDGIVNKVVDTTPAIFALSQAKTFDDKTTWLAHGILAPISTMIRSVGIEHEIPIAKTGWGARIGRIPITVAALLFEDQRNFFGKVLVTQFIGDSIHRYRQIVNSGNEQATQRINEDLAEYACLTLIGRGSLKNPTLREVIALGLGLAKLAQVKIRESYKPIGINR